MELESIVSVRRSARISNYYESRAFGFLNEEFNGVVLSYFFHLRDVQKGIPKIGEMCSFVPVVGEKGLRAKDIVIGTKVGA